MSSMYLRCVAFTVPKTQYLQAVQRALGTYSCSALDVCFTCPVLHRHICTYCVKPLWAVSGLAKADRSASANVFSLIRINNLMVSWLSSQAPSEGAFCCQTQQNLHLRETF